jgi:hypothetical protein
MDATLKSPWQRHVNAPNHHNHDSFFSSIQKLHDKSLSSMEDVSLKPERITTSDQSSRLTPTESE